MVGKSSSNNTNLLLYYRDVVRQMMFAFGDFEDPIPACIDLVLDVAKFQMVQALEEAWQHANANSRKIIMLEDVLLQFKRHKFTLKRLLQFAIAAESVNELKRAAPRTAKLDEEREEDSEVDEEELPTVSVPDTNLNRMKNVVDSMHLGVNANELLELPDPVYEERKVRIFRFANELTQEEFFRFSEARQATFRDDSKQRPKKYPSEGSSGRLQYIVYCSCRWPIGCANDASLLRVDGAVTVPHHLVTRRVPYGNAPASTIDKASFAGYLIARKNDTANLLRWLGAPQCEDVIPFVLAFIGREVVAQMVESAFSIREFEEPNLFLDDDQHGNVALPNGRVPLQIRHYNEVLRRCIGWRRRKNFLFGYYDDSEVDSSTESSAVSENELRKCLSSSADV